MLLLSSQGAMPHLRIPTKPVSIPDASVGVDNTGAAQNLVGRDYTPLGCLEDDGNFVHTLVSKGYACVVVKALKLSRFINARLFDMKSRNRFQQDFHQKSSQLIELSI